LEVTAQTPTQIGIEATYPLLISEILQMQAQVYSPGNDGKEMELLIGRHEEKATAYRLYVLIVLGGRRLDWTTEKPKLLLHTT